MEPLDRDSTKGTRGAGRCHRPLWHGGRALYINSLCCIDLRVLGSDMLGWAVVRVLCTASPTKKTSRLQATVGGRLLVGLIDPVKGGHDARAVPNFRDRQTGKETLTSPLAVPRYGNVGQPFSTIGIQ